MATAKISCFLSDGFDFLPNFNRQSMRGCFVFLACLVILGETAPRSKGKKNDGPQLVFDQKQTGDYNIQLHLKDFQIIALLGDDALGDYDYNYDYADFTVKPSAGTSTSTTTPTTQKPPPSSPSSTTTPSTSNINKTPPSTSTPVEASSSTSENVNSHQNSSNAISSNSHPYIEVVVLESTKKPEDIREKFKVKSVLNENFESNEEQTGLNTNKLQQNSSSESFLNEITTEYSPSSSQNPENVPSSSTFPPVSPTGSTDTPSLEDMFSMTPGKIKVQILDAPSTMELVEPHISIVPGEEVGEHGALGALLSEQASYRKCATGFSRDKRGRCRKVRRPGVTPQLPFGFSRLASNLASRLRLTPSESSVASTAES